MSFGTIFTSESSLFATLNDQAENIGKLFTQLDGKEEWNVRIYYDRNKLAASVASNAPAIVAFRKELAEMPAGKQFLMSKKADRLIAEETDRELVERVDHIHQAILRISAALRSKQLWTKSLTARGDDMAANHAYLIPRESRDEFQEIVRSCREALGEEAWSTEISGPWPPYHFAELT